MNREPNPMINLITVFISVLNVIYLTNNIANEKFMNIRGKNVRMSERKLK